MKFRSGLTLLIFAAAFALVSCSQKGTTNTPTAGALSSNSATSGASARLFDRRNLDVSGFNNLTEFIRPEVRERLDQEPAGTNDEGYVPPPVVTERPYEPPDSDQQETYSEENPVKELELEKVKFLWAKKKFGDALGADQTAGGVIVLYADENYYDIGRLVHFVEEGRDRIAANSGVDTARIQVVFGGYRGVAQVEFWLVPAGQNMPDIRPESRDAPGDTEN